MKRQFIRLAALILVLLLSVSFTACNNTDKVDSSKQESTLNSSFLSSDSSLAESSDEDSSTPTESKLSASGKSTAPTSKGSSKASSTASKSNNSKSEDYGDVAPEAYQATVKPSMTGKLSVDLGKTINKNIIGGGVNFAFSDYVYYDFDKGDGFNLQVPYCFNLKELEEPLWEDYFKLIDFTCMQYVRLQVSFTQWEPINDNNDPFSTDFKKGFIFSPDFKKRPEAASVPKNTYMYLEKMYRLLDYFEKKGIYVILGNWSGGQGAAGFCANGKNWLSSGGTMSRDGLYINNEDEFAETFAAIMYHLIKEKKYTCVKGFSIYNETEGFNDFESVLTRVYNKCGDQLKRLGIRDKVLIQAYDGAMMWNRESGYGTGPVERMLKNCGENMDIFSVHHYVSTIEAGPQTSRMQGTIQSRLIKDFVAPAIRLAGNRPVILGELGTFAYAPETGSVEYGAKDIRLPIFNAEAATAIFNAGAKGYGLWAYNTVIHTYFSMLDYDVNNKYAFVPDSINYYPTALMIKYIPSGMNIVSNSISGCTLNNKQRVFATVGEKNGQITILLVNDSEEPAKVTISGINTSKRFYYHYICKDKTDRIYPGGNFKITNNTNVALRPQSIVALTTYTHGTQTVR